MRLDEAINRVFLWLGGLPTVSRVMATVAIMIGAVITGAVLALMMMGILCLLAN